MSSEIKKKHNFWRKQTENIYNLKYFSLINRGFSPYKKKTARISEQALDVLTAR